MLLVHNRMPIHMYSILFNSVNVLMVVLTWDIGSSSAMKMKSLPSQFTRISNANKPLLFSNQSLAIHPMFALDNPKEPPGPSSPTLSSRATHMDSTGSLAGPFSSARPCSLELALATEET